MLNKCILNCVKATECYQGEQNGGITIIIQLSPSQSLCFGRDSPGIAYFDRENELARKTIPEGCNQRVINSAQSPIYPSVTASRDTS